MDEYRAESLRHTVEKLSFMITRSRRYIHAEVSFIATRVKRPYEDDWGKLNMATEYLKRTKYTKLTLRVDSLELVRCWIDASCNAHTDYRVHIGIMMNLSQSAVLSSSLKHKLNVNIYT